MRTLHFFKYYCFLLLTVTIFSVSCTKEENIKLPIVSTESTTSNITATTAQSGGSITDTKGEIVIAHGVCWSINSNPTIKDSITKETNETGKYISQLHSLLPNTQYFLRAYATNHFGTAYGDIISFKTIVDIVKLTTTEINSITSTTAIGGGTINDDGNGVVSERGICWNSTPNPTILNYKTSDGTGKGSFKSTLSGLTRNTTYYVKAYARNDRGVSYGPQTTFNTLAELATVTTTLPSNIGENNVQLGGNVTDNGSAVLFAKGICYSTNHNPTITDSHTNSGTTSGAWATILTGMSPSTNYFVRAYASNNMGTTYGNEMSFITLASPYSAGAITDIDGNSYKTITIGNQTWMAENLRTTKYNNGSAIPYITDFDTWQRSNTPAYCWPENDVSNKDIYGALYNWFTVNTGKLAPTGWHIATIDEWRTLKTYLMNNNYYVTNVTTNLAKSLASNFGWRNSTNTGAIGNDISTNNKSTFNAVPSGCRQVRLNFSPIGITTSWWTPNIDYTIDTLLPYNLGFDFNSSILSEWSGSDRQSGFSVRCVKD